MAKRRWRGSHSASGNLAAAVQAVYISVSLETRQALEIWRDYNGRATVVCRIDELKNELAADHFCLRIPRVVMRRRPLSLGLARATHASTRHPVEVLG